MLKRFAPALCTSVTLAIAMPGAPLAPAVGEALGSPDGPAVAVADGAADGEEPGAGVGTEPMSVGGGSLRMNLTSAAPPPTKIVMAASTANWTRPRRRASASVS